VRRVRHAGEYGARDGAREFPGRFHSHPISGAGPELGAPGARIARADRLPALVCQRAGDSQRSAGRGHHLRSPAVPGLRGDVAGQANVPAMADAGHRQTRSHAPADVGRHGRRCAAARGEPAAIDGHSSGARGRLRSARRLRDRPPPGALRLAVGILGACGAWLCPQESPTSAQGIPRGQTPEPAWPLVLRGNQQPGSPTLEELSARFGLAEHVIVLPHLNREDLSALYGAASALVFPSLYEGGGIPVLEAQACGCPVLASDLPAIREFAGDGALYMNPQSDVDMKRAMMALVEDPSGRRAHSYMRSGAGDGISTNSGGASSPRGLQPGRLDAAPARGLRRIVPHRTESRDR
jgi:hypothetical protein